MSPIRVAMVALALLVPSALLGCSSPDDVTGGRADRTSLTAAPDTDADPSGTRATTGPTTSSPPRRSPSSAPPTTEPATTDLAGRIVVIDPGHNGANGAHPAEIGRLVDAGGFQKGCNTTGTAGDGYPEAELTWHLAQLVGARLRAHRATVLLTRDSNDGWGPCIDQRGLTAARAGADLLVSIHADGNIGGGPGFHVIRPSSSAGYTDVHFEQSEALARALRDSLVAHRFSPATYLASDDGIVERGDLGTLNRAGVPAAMVETGNMRDPGDLRRLRSAAGQGQIADALAAGIAAYLQSA